MERIILLGEDVLIEHLAKYGARVLPALRDAIKDEADLIFRESQLQVPYRTGVLKGSGRVSYEGSNGVQIVATISYGGAARAYAYVMHEGIINGRPINYRNGKKKKYLEDPVKLAAVGMALRLERRIAVILNG